jgi:hypothetical protein
MGGRRVAGAGEKIKVVGRHMALSPSPLPGPPLPLIRLLSLSKGGTLSPPAWRG